MGEEKFLREKCKEKENIKLKEKEGEKENTKLKEKEGERENIKLEQKEGEGEKKDVDYEHEVEGKSSEETDDEDLPHVQKEGAVVVVELSDDEGDEHLTF